MAEFLEEEEVHYKSKHFHDLEDFDIQTLNEILQKLR